MSSDQTASKIRSRSWPMWLFVAIALLLNVSLPPLFEWIAFGGFERAIQALVFLAGVIIGELCFVVLVVGLTKRTWLGAHLFGLGLTVLGYLAVAGGFWLAGNFDREMIVGLALLPLYLLVAASPLSGLRRLFGWRLDSNDEVLPRRQPLRLADIFSLIAIVASVLVLARVPQVILEYSVSDHWLTIAITGLSLFGASLVILPLHARVVFGGLSMRHKTAWLAILPILMTIICFGISQCFMSRDTLWSERLEILPYLLILLVPAIGTFYLSLLLLAASGLRLVRGSQRMQSSQREGDKNAAASLQRLTWWRIGAAVAVTMATSIYLENLTHWRVIRDKENAILSSRAQATGGGLGIDYRIPTRLTLGAAATDADLPAFMVCTRLSHLELDNCKVTDRGLAFFQYFPKLQVLELKNLPISDDGLVHLEHLPRLEILFIRNCQVKASAIGSLPEKRRLHTLDLTETQFGDDECKMLAEFPALSSLTLNNTRVTDRGLATLGGMTTLTRLELVGTEIETASFPLLPVLDYLDLSKTNANDATVASIARLSKLQFLSLRETKITNAALAELSRLPDLTRIDLSGTAIDDAGIAKLNVMSIGEFYELSLANTAVTDACLQHFAQTRIATLDVRHTNITYNGLIANGLPGIDTLLVESHRFTPQEEQQLESQLILDVKVTGD